MPSLLLKEVEGSRGGGGTFIGQAMPILTTKVLFKAPDDTEWIRSGFMETDIDSYPDTSKYVSAIAETDNVPFPTLTGAVTAINKSAYDQVTEKIYVLDTSGNCDEYNKAGVFIRSLPGNLHIAPVNSATGLAVNDGVIYVLSSTNTTGDINYFDIDGTYLSTFSTALTGGPNSGFLSLQYHKGYLYAHKSTGSTLYLLRTKADGSEGTGGQCYSGPHGMTNVASFCFIEESLVLVGSQGTSNAQIFLKIRATPFTLGEPDDVPNASTVELLTNPTSRSGWYNSGALAIDGELALTFSLTTYRPNAKYPVTLGVGSDTTEYVYSTTSDYRLAYYKRIK